MTETANARGLRKKQTWAERRLWSLLRSRRLAGYKFRRQHPEGPYFLYFYCIEARVAVESDGVGHGHPLQQRSDKKRDEHLTKRGILVKRVWNSQLAKRDDRATFVENLWQILQQRTPHPENVALPPYRRTPDHPKNSPSP